MIAIMNLMGFLIMFIKAHSILKKAIKVIIKKLPPSSSRIALHQIGKFFFCILFYIFSIILRNQ